MSGSPGPCFEERRGGSEIRDRDQSKYDLCKHRVQEIIPKTDGIIETWLRKAKDAEISLFMLQKPQSMSPVYLVMILTRPLVTVMGCSLSSVMRTEC